jgi:hypothetical protein
LSTKVFPAASACGSIHSGTMTGKLKGTTPATTPSGSCVMLQVDAAADVELFTLGHVLEAEAELEALDALEHVALGLGVDLAVLVRDQPGQLLDGRAPSAP